MNIFEELAESYTYNGVVSLKALDDDIVTLENQIDSFNATLKELQLRGKKPGPLVGKIRDAKIRLSLLKAVYKKESDKATPDDVILNMLGVSAKHANETPEVKTAASGKKPKPQNFESAELERKIDEPVSVEEKTPVSEKVVDSEIVITKEDEAEMQASVFQGDVDDETAVMDNNALLEGINEPHNNVKAENEPGLLESSISNTDNEPDPLESLKDKTICKEVEFKEVSDIMIPLEKGGKIVDGVSTINIKDKVTDANDNPAQPLIQDDGLEPADINNGATGSETETVENTETVPPPTMDDYLEPASGPSYEDDCYDKDGIVYSDENRPELTDTEVIINAETACDPSETVIDTEDIRECEDAKVYDMFYNPDNKIYVSFDLYDYTNLVNTNSITGLFNEKYKTLELTFTDMRDYPLLLFFLNERNKKCAFFSRFGKKGRSIIMYVRTEIDGVEKEYRYEFTGCRLVEVFGPDYKSMQESVYYGTSTYEFFAKFKYKRLKIS